MNRIFTKSSFRHLLDELPISAGLYWQLRNQIKTPQEKHNWRNFEIHLPELVTEVLSLRKRHSEEPITDTKRLFIFGSQRSWIKYSALLGLAMSAIGHDVSLAYTPFIKWHKRLNRFEHHRQERQVSEVLNPIREVMNVFSLTEIHHQEGELPLQLVNAIEQVSIRDVQYTLQIEDVDQKSDLFHLRLERNTQAAKATLEWLVSHTPDVIITPNGSILEMGVVYEVARFLGIPVVTFEFGEQRGRIWMAKNSEVMLQETDILWSCRQDNPLSDSQWIQIRDLFASRQRASLWQNFARLWQEQPTKGGDRVRQELGLDERLIILLPANVIGDSLTLGRQVFSESMTEWLEQTILHFADKPDVQLIVRIHPGERYLVGPSVADVARRVLPDLDTNPMLSHIHLLPADAAINTYDLVEIADLGMVYTTTVGLEMGMSGVPVVVAGQTHYRGKGFTLDPSTWQEYYQLLDQAMNQTEAFRLERYQVEQAWNYAYRFFFEYPLPFPWHLSNYWETIAEWPISRALSDEGWAKFGHTFRYLTGEPRDW